MRRIKKSPRPGDPWASGGWKPSGGRDDSADAVTGDLHGGQLHRGHRGDGRLVLLVRGGGVGQRRGGHDGEEGGEGGEAADHGGLRWVRCVAMERTLGAGLGGRKPVATNRGEG